MNEIPAEKLLELGELIHKARVFLGFTQKQFANRAGISTTSVQTLEAGKSKKYVGSILRKVLVALSEEIDNITTAESSFDILEKEVREKYRQLLALHSRPQLVSAILGETLGNLGRYTTKIERDQVATKVVAALSAAEPEV